MDRLEYAIIFREAVATRDKTMMETVMEEVVPTITWLELLGELRSRDPEGFEWLMNIIKGGDPHES